MDLIDTLRDELSFTFHTFEHKPTRAWLTILGVFIGIAAVVALISLGQGLQDTLNAEFEKVGVDKIMVSPGTGAMALFAGFTGAERLTDHDVNVIERAKGVEKAIGFTGVLGKVGFKDEEQYTFVIGYDPSKMTMQEGFNTPVEKGRELKSGDKYKILIGYEIAHSTWLFSKEVKIGDTLRISGADFTVVGIVDKIGSRQDDTQVYIPKEASDEIYHDPGYALMYVITKTGFLPGGVADNIMGAMRKDRDQKKGEEDFSVTTFEQLAETSLSVISTVQTVIIGIAAISLIVGGIGIMNTMYTSVLERTHEIGVMKAIGAKNSDIMMIFLLESGILGLVGGLIGVGLGMGVGMLVSAIISQSLPMFLVSFPPWLTIGSLAFSFIVGSLSGALPALQAARMKPAEALRH